MTEYQKLKHLREVFKLSQEEFAISIGLKQSVYSKIERGQSQLSNEAASNIMSVYKVNPNWWFFGEEPIFTVDQKSLYEISESEWKEKYYRAVEENAALYKKLLREEEQKTESLKNN